MAKERFFSGITATRIKAIILSLVIAVVLAGFVVYLVESIYPSPKHDDFCGDVRVPKPILDEKGITEEDQATCEADGGAWKNGWCDYYYECNQKFEDANDRHKLVMFVVGAIIGLIAISIGIILALSSVSSGLMLGGGFLIFYGTAQYWSNLNNWARALILGVALVVLIWLGYKKLKA